MYESGLRKKGGALYQLWLPEGRPDILPRVGESVNPEEHPLPTCEKLTFSERTWAIPAGIPRYTPSSNPDQSWQSKGLHGPRRVVGLRPKGEMSQYVFSKVEGRALENLKNRSGHWDFGVSLRALWVFTNSLAPAKRKWLSQLTQLFKSCRTLNTGSLICTK